MTIVLQETQRAVFYAPFYAALALDVFRREGVDVELRSSAKPEDAANALFTGAANVSWGGPMRVMLNFDRDPASDLVCFCEVVTRDPFFLVGREPRPEFNLTDLVDMRLAVVAEVPTPWMCLQEDIRREGLDPLKLHVGTSCRMLDNVAALRAGTIDVVQLFEPLVTELVEERRGYIWHVAADRGPTSYTCLYARRGVVDGRRDELLRIARSIARTQEWVHSAPAADIAELVSPYFAGAGQKQLTAALGRYKELGIWGRNPLLPRAGYERLKASLLSGGLIKAALPFESAVDNSLAEEIIGKYMEPLSTREPAGHDVPKRQ